MVQKRLQYKNSTISYECFGSGQEFIFCFHGYGQAAYRWEILTPYLDKRFTLIAFDLPFHGNTQWNKTDPFTPQDLLTIIQEILPSSINQFNLLGYSMGGRIALGLLLRAPQMIKKIVLLAPDGLHRNKWYRFATHTMVGRKMFYSTMKNPKLLWRLGQELRRRGVISENYLNLAKHYMSDDASRMQLYYRWMATRDFHPNLFLLKQKITKYHIPVEMVFAKHDKIIIADHGIAFMKGLEKQARIHIIDTGHSFLYAPQAAYIASFFNEEK